MKRITLLAITLLAITTINAQDILLKNSPFHFADATFKMSIEKELSGDKSVNLSGSSEIFSGLISV